MTVTTRQVLRHRELRRLLTASVVSDLGDLVARVALAVTVYGRSGSALQAALVYAVSLLPWAVGGPLLGALADRLPARRVLVGCDLLRAVLIGAMALGTLPVGVLLGLVLLGELAAAPFGAARSALLPEVLPEGEYEVGAGIVAGAGQACQVLGYAVGGLSVAVLGTRGALAADAVSFLGSAVLLRTGLAARPAAAAGPAPSLWRDTVEGWRFVAASPRVRHLLVAAFLGCAVVVLPEALLTPYALDAGLSARALGLLLAVGPLSSCVAGLVVTRADAAVRRRLLLPVLALAALPLPLVALRPPTVVLAVLLAVSGAGGACVLLAQTSVVPEVPAALRGRVFGLAGSGLMVAQGLSVLLGGLLAEVVPPATVIGLAGWAGLAAVGLVALPTRREPVPAQAAVSW